MAMDYLLYKDQLKGTYAKAFDKVQLYLEVRNIDGSIPEEMMMNLLDMLLEAQKENKPVEKIMGQDIEQFCESYFEDYNIKTRLTDQIPKRTYHVAWIVFIIELLDMLSLSGEKNFSILTATTDISGYMCGLIIGFIPVIIARVFIRPYIFRWKKVSSTLFDAIVFVVTTAMFFAGCILIGDNSVNIPLLPVLIISGFYIIVFIIVRAVHRYQDHGSIWKETKIFEGSMFRKIGKNTERELPAELVKRYHHINKRRRFFKKEELTPEQFTEKIRKETKSTKRWIIGCAIVMGGVILHLVIDSAMTESIFDAIIFAIILCAVEYPIFHFFIWVTRVRTRILEECDKRGITIEEYAELLERESAPGIADKE